MFFMFLWIIFVCYQQSNWASNVWINLVDCFPFAFKVKGLFQIFRYAVLSNILCQGLFVYDQNYLFLCFLIDYYYYLIDVFMILVWFCFSVCSSAFSLLIPATPTYTGSLFSLVSATVVSFIGPSLFFYQSTLVFVPYSLSAHHSRHNIFFPRN